jgi:superfamily II DNA or RNA helicase
MSQPKLVIRRSGNLIEVVGGAAYEQMLRPSLVYQHRQSYHGPALLARKRFIQSEAQAGRTAGINPYLDFFDMPLYVVQGGNLGFPAGLKARVTQLLDANGVAWTFQDLRSRRLPPADYARLAELPDGFDFRYRQDEVLALIDSTEGCVIDAPTGYGKSHIAVRLCKTYPHSRIVIASPGVDLVRGLYERLHSVGVFDVGRVGDGHCESAARVTLASADSLHRVNLEQADLLVYDECHTAGTPERQRQLARFTEAKMIGFTASASRGDGSWDVVEAIFGPIEMRVSYQAAAANNAVCPIKVLMVEIGEVPGYKNPYDGEAWKRRAYWRNDYRNATIAATLQQLVPQYLANDPDPQTLVMVETVDHAYELRQQLPNYQIVYATLTPDRQRQLQQRKLWQPNEQILNDANRDVLRKQFEDGVLRRAISTFTWKQGVNFAGLAVLFRADGGDSDVNNIQIPGRLSRLKDGKDFGLLVDTIDRFDPKAYRRSQGRMKDYRSLGWQIIKTSIQLPTSSPSSSASANAS